MTDSSSTGPVLVSNRGAVRIITLNRPDKRNAIDIELRIALAEAIEAADADASVRVIVLTGAGKAFCSGGDISTMQRIPAGPALERARLAQRVIAAIWTTSKPVVAAVEGSAFGAGTALAAACDVVVAGGDARFATTFTGVGLAGDMGCYVSLPARVGMARARQMLLMPSPMSANEALDAGLIDMLTESGAALSVALRSAARLAEGPAQAYGVIKSLLAAAPTLHPLEMLEQEATHQAVLFDTDDFEEGAAAFREKRKPVFGAVRR
ncbi:enoyl-CoA hydratase-related protein [Mycobacterium sp.]|uniref:enoyl-CoA hydratase/isomerase family protein n=1 Tax=Mycobacterium sp. TaxID=1785 RepID=UPI0025D9447D|nr:enoyl-CoA hydratase-related protein [Mycobacterium sp.]